MVHRDPVSDRNVGAREGGAEAVQIIDQALARARRWMGVSGGSSVTSTMPPVVVISPDS